MGIRSIAQRAPKNGNGDEPPITIQQTTVWKLVSLLLFGVLILFATDMLELKVSSNKSGTTTIDGHVEVKDTDSSNPLFTHGEDPRDINNNNNNNSSETPNEDITAPTSGAAPVAAVEPEPTAAPVPAPTDAPVAETPRGIETERSTYQRRGQPITEADRTTLTSKWGSWTLPETPGKRPATDIYAAHPNRDIPSSDLPATAWQLDATYLEGFLTQSLDLVIRAQEAILAEYGYASATGGADPATFEERSKMFQLTHYATSANTTLQEEKIAAGMDQGGWTTPRSWEGLKRRLRHAIYTEDSFVVAMGGHSAAAGHGNHFIQSYILQVQWILEPIFARLGVKHQSRNFGCGGLGTLHNALAAGSIYGAGDVDFLAWDSAMTEKEAQAIDLFSRQGLTGGERVPVLWSMTRGIPPYLHDMADVDMGGAGTGHSGIPTLETVDKIDEMPYAIQYLNCGGDIFNICRENEYNGVCWIERDDVTPTMKQGPMGGRAKWHPGNRQHQLVGRILTFTLLSALNEVLVDWKSRAGYQLADEDWHVTSYYENIRTKLAALDETGPCYKYEGLEFICKYPFKGRTEFTPRANPEYSSIQSMMTPEASAALARMGEVFYQPPDVFNPALHPPAGQVDVLNIVENGVDFPSLLNPDYVVNFYKKPQFTAAPQPSGITIGKGIRASECRGLCNGGIDSFCCKSAVEQCLLSGHNDKRSGLLFHSLSGWLTFTIPDVLNGYIIIKMETWHTGTKEIPHTNGWTTINNETSRRGLRSPPPQHGGFVLSSNHTASNSTMSSSSSSSILQQRQLKAPPPEICETFKFEYSIDGKITALGAEEFKAQKKQLQRVVETLTILEDPKYTGGQEKEVAVAIRMTGCEPVLAFALTHVYWS